MQQKYLKYLLLLGVALIWGVVIYKVLGVIADKANPRQVFSQKSVFNPKDSSSYQPYDLLVNYEDPFGADEEKTSLESSTDALIRATEKYLQSTSNNNIKPDIGFIQYKGIITNPVTHKKAAIISINGKDELARLNSVLSNIRINAIKKDKIQITYLGEKYWINRY